MSTLAQAEIRALNEALDDEYRSWATYDQVIADFGEPAFQRCAQRSAGSGAGRGAGRHRGGMGRP
ncbi:MAG: hypothetical protein HYU44_14665 [Betaproteobacteria bacterium]|nr:hypothetical protein [Betaproteobacteria bacterium]MBI2293313.1 hypothetical protein [Betaproteobacteria bacterium]